MFIEVTHLTRVGFAFDLLAGGTLSLLGGDNQPKNIP
jgi:hypothetical protein